MQDTCAPMHTFAGQLHHAVSCRGAVNCQSGTSRVVYAVVGPGARSLARGGIKVAISVGRSPHAWVV